MTFGADVGGTNLRVALIDGYNIVKQVQEPVMPHEIAEQIIRLIQAWDNCTPTSIGVGIAGQISDGIVLFSPNLALVNYPLKAKLQQSFKVPIRIINDVQAAAWGEAHSLTYTGQEAKNLAVIFMGTGIGGGYLKNGELVEGTAGEIGHMVIREGGLKCTCGRRGCLEPYAGGWGLAKRAFRLSAKEVFEANDQDVIRDGFMALTTALANFVNIVNPDIILIGGGLLAGYESRLPNFLIDLEKGIKEEALQGATTHLIVDKAQLGENAVLYGSALLGEREGRQANTSRDV